MGLAGSGLAGDRAHGFAPHDAHSSYSTTTVTVYFYYYYYYYSLQLKIFYRESRYIGSTLLDLIPPSTYDAYNDGRNVGQSWHECTTRHVPARKLCMSVIDRRCTRRDTIGHGNARVRTCLGVPNIPSQYSRYLGRDAGIASPCCTVGQSSFSRNRVSSVLI